MSSPPLPQEEVIRRFRNIHGDTYDYSKTVYVNASTPVIIICKEHGEFKQIPDSHWRGKKCKKCANKIRNDKNRNSQSEILARAKIIHEDKYDYSKVIYVSILEKVIIGCPIHGDFEQTMGNHVNMKAGCTKCAREFVFGKFRKSNTEEFISRVAPIHKYKYDYSKVDYETTDGSKVEIICPIHGSFFQLPMGHLRGHGCNSCQSSNQEASVVDYIQSLGVSISRNNRTIIKPHELDIVIEDKKIAIEYNGVYFHSEKFKANHNYHANKTLACNQVGYRLIQIFEDEWRYNESIVKSRLKHILNIKSNERIFARKLKVKSISYPLACEFLKQTHIQGPGTPPKYAYGLFNGEELVACMTFCENRYKKESEDVELLRFSSSCSIPGGFSKLLTAFKRSNPDVKSIISFSDRRWSEGNVYTKNGFVLDYTTKPGYDYINTKGERLNRERFMKHKLPALFENYDDNLTEEENCANNSLFRIWNCGMDKWKWTRPD